MEIPTADVFPPWPLRHGSRTRPRKMTDGMDWRRSTVAKVVEGPMAGRRPLGRSATQTRCRQRTASLSQSRHVRCHAAFFHLRRLVIRFQAAGLESEAADRTCRSASRAGRNDGNGYRGSAYFFRSNPTENATLGLSWPCCRSSMWKR